MSVGSSTNPLSPVQEWRRGWTVVGAAAAGTGTGAALYQYMSSLFVEPLEAAFGWTRDDIGGAAALGLLGAISAPLVGRVVDRVGIRPVATVCILVLMLAYTGLAFMTGELWQFVLCTALIGVAAPGCTGLVYSRAVNAWFDTSKGLALGTMSAGLSVATLATAPILVGIIADHGHRGGFLFLAALAGGIGLPAMLAGVRVPASAAPLTAARQPGAPVGPILRTRAFWLLAGGMFVQNMTATGIMTQLVPIVTAAGLSRVEAASYLSLYAASVLVGRIGVGWLFDRTDARRTAAMVAVAAAAGCLSLRSDAPESLLVAAIVLVGLLQGAETDVLAYFVARLFDPRAYGTTYGLLFTICLLGTAAGIVGFGWMFVATGGYDIALAVGAATFVLVAILYASLPRPART